MSLFLLGWSVPGPRFSSVFRLIKFVKWSHEFVAKVNTPVYSKSGGGHNGESFSDTVGIFPFSEYKCTFVEGFL